MHSSVAILRDRPILATTLINSPTDEQYFLTKSSHRPSPWGDSVQMNGICHKVQKFKGLANSNKNFLLFILKIPLYRIVMEGVDKKKPRNAPSCSFVSHGIGKDNIVLVGFIIDAFQILMGFSPGSYYESAKAILSPIPHLKFAGMPTTRITSLGLTPPPLPSRWPLIST